jgi:hypothetical protein
VSRYPELAGIVALAGVAAVVAGCGGSVAIGGTCAAYQRGTHVYLVRRFVHLPPAAVQKDCARIAAQIGGLTVVTRSAYRGDIRICRDSDGFAIYAKPRNTFARDYCQDSVNPRTRGRKAEVVLRLEPPSGPPVYLVLRGPRAETERAARQWPGPKQVVRRPRGTKACQSRGESVYSTSKSLGARFCRIVLNRK